VRHFEKTCKELNIKLFVLKPASPKYNGRVESRELGASNRIVREKFYVRKDILANSIEAFSYELSKFV
jgi:hypothetical protein